MDELEQLKKQLEEARERQRTKYLEQQEPLRADIPFLSRRAGYAMEDIKNAIMSANKNPSMSKLYDPETGERIGSKFKNPLTGRETNILGDHLSEEAMPDTEEEELLQQIKRAEHKRRLNPMQNDDSMEQRRPASIDNNLFGRIKGMMK